MTTAQGEGTKAAASQRLALLAVAALLGLTAVVPATAGATGFGAAAARTAGPAADGAVAGVVTSDTARDGAATTRTAVARSAATEGATAPTATDAPAPPPVDPPVRPVRRKSATIAQIVAPVTARSRPDARSRAVWRVPTATGWSHQAQALLVLRSARDANGRRWLELELPIRPNSRTGWVPDDYVRLTRTTWWIEVAVARRVVSVFRAGRLVRRFRAVVGAPRTPTPLGLYAVWEKNPQPNPNDFLGPWAIPITALSNVLESYGGGPGRIGLHGRSGESLRDPLGSAASHGCIRVDNRHITWLARRVPHGTPVLVHR